LNAAPASAFSSLRRLPAPLVVAAGMALAQWPIYRRTVVSLDEGQLAAIGHRLASGETLYRDIYTGIFPGIYWMAEALMRVFGTDVVVLRGAQLVANSLIAALLFVLARPLAPGRAAWMVPVGFWVLVIASFPVFTMLTYSSMSLVSALGALVFVRRYVEGARTGDGLAAGVLLGLATVFKQNFGALALVAVLLSALWTRREGRLGDVPWPRAFALPIAGGAAVAVLAVARLVAGGAWPNFFEATFLTIFASQAEAFDQPLPPVFGAHPSDGLFTFLYGPGALFGAMFRGDRFATPAIISRAVRLGYGSAYLALGLTPLLALLVAHRSDRATVRIAAKVVLPFAALFFLGIFPSAIWSHLAAVYPPLLVVLAAAASLLAAALARRAAVLGKLVGVGAALTLAALVVFTARLEYGIAAAFAEPLMLPSASLRVSRRDARLYRAADDFLQTCAAEGEPVLVLPDMPLLYVTSGRPNPTPYDLIIPGDVRESVILERLASARVSCIVFNPAMYVQFDPFEKLFPGLAELFARDFEAVRTLKVEGTEWRFLRRRADPVSPPEARS
jgi:hypothetical protein